MGDWYPHKDISLDKLCKKVVTLLALVTAHRVPTLSKIKVQNIEVCPDDRITIKIPELIKTSRAHSKTTHVNITFFFNEKPQICPVNALLDYKNRTNSIITSDQLLISFKSR